MPAEDATLLEVVEVGTRFTVTAGGSAVVDMVRTIEETRDMWLHCVPRSLAGEMLEKDR